MAGRPVLCGFCGFVGFFADVLSAPIVLPSRAPSTRIRGAPDSDPPRPGWEPHDGRDPAWAQPALLDPTGGALWLGGSSNFEMRITALMQQYAHGGAVLDRVPGVT